MIAPVEPGLRPQRVDPWRAALARLSRGLLIYGLFGLVVAALGLGALLYVSGRVTNLGQRVSTEVRSLIATIDQTATVLDDAASSAESITVTLERTPPTVRQAAATVTNLQANLRTTEAQLASIIVLGSQPLANVAALFGQMASDMDGLDTRLGLIATDLEANRAVLLENAGSLRALGRRLDAIADDLRTGLIQDSLTDIGIVLMVMAVVLVGWAGLPAIGALSLGFWLRHELRRKGRAAVPEAGRWDGPDGAPGE